jgi:peptidyl-prolyl cis-trans isomerase A (cyclophilin A)
MRSNSHIRALALLIPLMLMARPVLAQKYVCTQSSVGDWCMQLLPSVAPKTVTNFLRYVNNGDYTNNVIHRSVPGFVVQGGGFRWNEDESKSFVTSYGNITNEFALSNLRGTVAMAKIGSDPNSASNQWFINLADNSANLDTQNGGFTVFAVVAYGMEVVDRIAGLRRVNLVNSVGNAAFDTVPTTAPANATQISYADMVIIKRAYASDVLPYHCTPNVTVEALAELCSSAVTFPVQLLPSGQVYQATLELVATKPNLVLRVKTGSLVTLAATPVNLEKFDSTKGTLTVPSVRVGGNIFTNVQLTLTDSVKLEFTVTGYN